MYIMYIITDEITTHTGRCGSSGGGAALVSTRHGIYSNNNNNNNIYLRNTIYALYILYCIYCNIILYNIKLFCLFWLSSLCERANNNIILYRVLCVLFSIQTVSFLFLSTHSIVVVKKNLFEYTSRLSHKLTHTHTHKRLVQYLPSIIIMIIIYILLTVPPVVIGARDLVRLQQLRVSVHTDTSLRVNRKMYNFTPSCVYLVCLRL